MVGGWLAPILNLLGMGAGGTIPTPDLTVLVEGDEVASYSIPTSSSLATKSVAVTERNDGTADLTIASAAADNESNCSVSIVGTATGTLAESDSQDFTLNVTPAGYGDYSFDLVITSDDPDEGTVTVSFVGTARHPQASSTARRRISVPESGRRFLSSGDSDRRRRG